MAFTFMKMCDNNNFNDEITRDKGIKYFQRASSP